AGAARIGEALGVVDPKGAEDGVVNLQGDLPALDPDQLKTAVWALEQSGADIGTLAAPIIDEAEETNPAVVKAVVAWDAGEKLAGRLYSTRATAPAGDGCRGQNVGLYPSRGEALKALSPCHPR